MDFGIKGKVALVSGASAGIGRAIARELAQEGARIVLVARREGPLQEATDALTGAGFEAACVSADMTTEAGVARAVEAAQRAFGAPEIAIANAAPTNSYSFETTEIREYYRVYEELVMSMVYLAQAVLPAMKARGWGRLVNIGSVCAKEPHRFRNLVLSNTGRPAVLGLNKTLANEYAAHGITVNTILPGQIATGRLGRVNQGAGDNEPPLVEPPPRIPMQREGTPEEIAAACAFLCSTRASYVTGQAITVDGGWTRGLV